eukprot:GHVU01089823.1.p1 GENE.GHVU01089823.1~~GHVU01089823.1.p1  ORF type:complete len:390 (+),score=45.91 GHVU01089823.1:254-1423(+)
MILLRARLRAAAGNHWGASIKGTASGTARHAISRARGDPLVQVHRSLRVAPELGGGAVVAPVKPSSGSRCMSSSGTPTTSLIVESSGAAEAHHRFERPATAVPTRSAVAAGDSAVAWASEAVGGRPGTRRRAATLATRRNGPADPPAPPLWAFPPPRAALPKIVGSFASSSSRASSSSHPPSATYSSFPSSGPSSASADAPPPVPRGGGTRPPRPPTSSFPKLGDDEGQLKPPPEGPEAGGGSPPNDGSGAAAAEKGRGFGRLLGPHEREMLRTLWSLTWSSRECVGESIEADTRGTTSAFCGCQSVSQSVTMRVLYSGGRAVRLLGGGVGAHLPGLCVALRDRLGDDNDGGGDSDDDTVMLLECVGAWFGGSLFIGSSSIHVSIMVVL